MRRFRCVGLVLALTGAVVAACGGGNGAGPGGAAEDVRILTVYSSRPAQPVDRLVERFQRSSGIDVAIRRMNAGQVVPVLLREGDTSAADVVFAQDAGSLGALSKAGRLARLDRRVLEQVKEPFRSKQGDWVGVSGQVRTVVYNTDVLKPEDLPDSILGFTDPKWNARIGWAPTTVSFRAFVTGLRILVGEEAARAWLQGVKANQPKAYEANGPLVEAVSGGEVHVGFVNHSYTLELQAEGSAMKAANKYYGGGDSGALVNVAGVGILQSSKHQAEAEEFTRYLLSEPAQRFFAQEIFELPLAVGVPTPAGMPDVSSLTPPSIDLAQLEDVRPTTELLRSLGI